MRDDLLAISAPEGTPDDDVDRILDEEEAAIASESLDTSRMPAVGCDVVRQAVPPKIGVAAVRQAAAAVYAPVVRRPRVVVHAVTRSPVDPDHSPRHVQLQSGPAAIGGIVDQLRSGRRVVRRLARGQIRLSGWCRPRSRGFRRRRWSR